MRCSGVTSVRRLLAAGLVTCLGVSSGAMAQSDEVGIRMSPPAVANKDLVHLRVEGSGPEFLPRGTTILYTSKNQTGFRYNPGAAGGTIPADPTRVAFDEVSIPSTRLAGNTTINVCKVVVGIRRVGSATVPAVATDVSVFWATATNGPIAPDTALDSPGTLIGTQSLAASTATVLTEVTFGATGGPTLFTVPLNMGFVTDAAGNPASTGSFMLGVSLSNPDATNGWRMTNPSAVTAPVSDPNANVFWQFDPNLSGQASPEAAFLFSNTNPPNPPATFYIEITGTPVAATTPAACCITSGTGSTACTVVSGAAQCTQSGGSLGGSASCTPNPCAPPANDQCANATTLPLTGVPVTGQNINATVKALPGCGFDLVDGPAVFYKFTGNGNNVTLSTCTGAAGLDTILHVYCAPNGCAGPFNCVGGNDDANPACAGNAGSSTLTVPTISGDQYIVLVHGFQGATGAFDLSALDSGTASTVTTTCAARARCVIDTDAFDFAEADACGAGTGLDTNGACATPTVYPALGQVGKGTVSTTGTFRDVDWYLLPATAAGQTVSVAIHSETPVLVQLRNDAVGDCAATTLIAGSGFVIAACAGIDNDLFDVAVPATGNSYFLITTPSFNGDPCGTAANSQNDYRIKISVAAFGACCAPATNCSQLTFNDCATAGGTTWFEGLACSLGAGNIDPCSVTVGTCCSSAGVCSIVPNATTPEGTDCTTAGGIFTANPNATCAPSPCAPVGVCCRGATCNSTITTSGACTGSLIIGQTAGAAFVATSTACGATNISSTPCCLADYNKVGGVTVTDIFNFLTDWFAGSPFARVGSDGSVAPLAVQNIFDFLTNWFNGCNP